MNRTREEKIVELSGVNVACRDCSLHQLCLPIGISREDMERIDNIIRRRRPIARGETLFRHGDPFHSIYAVRSGSIKTFTPSDDGMEQVTGFHLPGEMIGLDAINGSTHPCSAKALDTASLCEIPFDELESLSHGIPSLQKQLLKIMSREILHDHNLLMMLGKKSAEERLASLLLSLSNRLLQRGFSAHEFNLSMSRNDIGNYLGLAVETVSRLFRRFREQGVLTVDRRSIQIHDMQKLKEAAGATARSSLNHHSC